MKKQGFLSLIMAGLLSLISTTLIAQVRANYAPEVQSMKKWQGTFTDYVPNQVIVKFKDTSGVRVQMKDNCMLRTTSVESVDRKLTDLGITEVFSLMPLTGGKKLNRDNMVVKSLTGRVISESDMSSLYLMKVSTASKITVENAVNQLNAMSEVEYAEPNYRIYATATGEEAIYSAEPLYSQQWGFAEINLPALWEADKITDKRPVIAIIDTGVEFTHSDIYQNVWANEKELNGVSGVDDDGNGFVDDMYGWDFVNQNNRMDDYNGHGTHCAGIAAATGNNGMGGAGANPDALIMPISVLQSDGSGDIATFIKGIDYATANGADILSMSLGSYAESIALEQALAKAYQKAVLVAAAGNDGRCIYPSHHKLGDKPMFPAAYTFVLGVQASAQGGVLAGFSNYDCDGPIYSSFGEEQQYNYELKAPGVNVISAYPGGKYKALNGTSMACPLVAGAISRLLQCKEYTSKEILFGDLIHSTTSNGNVDIFAAYQLDDSSRNPTLWNLANELDDTEGGDGDMRVDAGETINIYPTIRNDWGVAKNIKISIEIGENEDASLIRFVTNNVDFGYDLSSYAKGKSANPITIKVVDNCVDGRRIKLRLRATCDNISSELVQDFSITVENGVEIGGMITENTTLYPDVHYIVTKTLLVPEGVTLTILPGTVLKFKDGIGFNVASGTLICSGTPEQPIVFTSYDLSLCKIQEFYLNNNTLDYVVFENLIFSGSNLIADNQTGYKLNNCVFRNVKGTRLFLRGLWHKKCNIFDNYLSDYMADSYNANYECYYNNIANNVFHSTRISVPLLDQQKNSNLLLNTSNNLKIVGMYNPTSSIPLVYTPILPNYLGTSREDIAEMGVMDYDHPTHPIGYGMYDLSNMLTRPSAEAHGIVWKVVVNGYDAQDEYELLPPLGVGKHKFEVYFNRPMNKAVAPVVAMGVRSPYTQVSIAEGGEWNEEGTVYTVYLTIDGKTSSDGVNRIYVSSAEDDEYFEIPVEYTRFNVNVQSAGSMATHFFAEAGLGKVNLTWETDEEDFEDLLGYNIVRYTEGSDTIIINKTLIESLEQSFTDYDVVPGTTYYYCIQQMTTSLQSHNLSNVVASTPLTAAKGDANGSMDVDVADIVSEVAYMTNQNPQPFIFEAADVIADGVINVLDVVGTVNIIKNPEATASATMVNSSANYTVEDGILYVESPIALGGVQMRLNVSQESEITPLEALNGFETVSDNQGESEYLFFAFSMTGKTLSAGKHALMRIGNAEIDEIILCDSKGKNIVVLNASTSGVGVIAAMQMELPYPNPFVKTLTVPYKIGKDGVHDVKIVVSSVTGTSVAIYSGKAEYGNHSWTWNAGESVSAGVYFVSLYVDGKLMQTVKAVKRN